MGKCYVFSIFPVPFNVADGSVRLRADVGIGPYICDELRSI